MNVGFSFDYNGERKYFSAGGTYKIDESLTVTCELCEYGDFDAAYWVLHFENTGTENTGIISDIRDCDSTLPLNMPEKKRNGYNPNLADGDICVISMVGTFDG